MSDSATGAAPAAKQQSRHLTAIIAAVVVVILVVAGFFGYRTYANTRYDKASMACAAASDKVREAANGYNAIANGDAADVSSITAKQVTDAKTVDALAKARKESTPEYEGCVADDTKGLNDAASKLGQQEEWYQTHAKSLAKAVKAVTDSKASKDLDTAKVDLKGTLDSASKTLADSDGKVADNATLDSLKKAISDAQKIYDKKDVSDPKTYSDEKGKLEKAVKAVNDSIQAKKDSDENTSQEAAAAAAQAQAQTDQQQAQPYSGYTGGGYSNTSTGGSGSGYSAPTGGSANSTQDSNSSTPSNNGGNDTHKTPNGWTIDGNGNILGGTFCGTSDGKTFEAC